MSLVATLTQGLRAKYPTGFDKNEDRLSEYGAWETFRMDTDNPDSIITQEVIELAKRSAGNTLSIPVIDTDDVTISNTVSCTIDPYENTSALIQVTFATYFFGFSMVPAQYVNNDIKYQEDFNNKMKKFLKKFAETLDSAAVAKLEADKTSVMNSTLIGTGKKYGDLVGDAIQVGDDQQKFFFNDMSAIMRADDFNGGQYNVVGSTSLSSTVNLYVNQGNANAQNSEFQFGPYSFAYSNRVAVSENAESSLFVLPKGTLATFNRNHPDPIAKSFINEGNYFGLEQMPIVNMEMGFHYYKECSDQSGIVSPAQPQLKASVREFFMFYTDVAFLSAYNSDPSTLSGPIHKADMNVAQP